MTTEDMINRMLSAAVRGYLLEARDVCLMERERWPAREMVEAVLTAGAATKTASVDWVDHGRRGERHDAIRTATVLRDELAGPPGPGGEARTAPVAPENHRTGPVDRLAELAAVRAASEAQAAASEHLLRLLRETGHGQDTTRPEVIAEVGHLTEALIMAACLRMAIPRGTA